MDWLIEFLVALFVAITGAGGEHAQAPQVDLPEVAGQQVGTERVEVATPEFEMPGGFADLAQWIRDHLTAVADTLPEQAADEAGEAVNAAADTASDAVLNAGQVVDSAGEQAGETGSDAAPFEVPAAPAAGDARPDFAGRP